MFYKLWEADHIKRKINSVTPEKMNNCNNGLKNYEFIWLRIVECMLSVMKEQSMRSNNDLRLGSGAPLRFQPICFLNTPYN